MFFQNKDKDNNNKKGESAPLLLAPSNASGSGSTKYYFLSGQSPATVRDADGGEVVEGIPEGSHTDEFAPKQLPPMVRTRNGE